MIIHVFQGMVRACVHKHMMDTTADDWSLQYVLTNASIMGVNGNVTLLRHVGDIIQ